MEKEKFEDFGISKDVLKALEKLEYKNPTEVQVKVIPAAFKHKDIIVKSQTGSGKTAAFGIPLCVMTDIEEKNPQALVLEPTRELAVQVKDELSSVGRFKRVRCEAVYGKQPMDIQERELKQRVHIIVGTPGRTMDHIEKGNLYMGDIKYLVIDEADKMLNMGFIEQVEGIIKALPEKRVTMLFSATIPKEIETLCNRYMINPEKIEIEHERPTGERIEQWYYDIEDNKKFELLTKVIYSEAPVSSIIFCNTKEDVDVLNNKLKLKGFSSNGLHGGMEQKDRLETMGAFKKGEFSFLVATDVAARGIDIEGISLVVNYSVPVEKESYIHRIGRTGRAGSGGTAVTFVAPYEWSRFKEILEYIGYEVSKREMPTEDEVEKGKAKLKNSVNIRVKPRIDKKVKLSSDITKIHINAGKKKKVRPGDIAGTISSILGVNPEDVGIIDVQDTYSYVDVLNGKGELVLKEIEKLTLKGKKVKAQRAIK